MTASQYRRAMALLSHFLKTAPAAGKRSPFGRTVSLLAELIGDYENKRWPIPEPTAAEAKAFRKSQRPRKAAKTRGGA